MDNQLTTERLLLSSLQLDDAVFIYELVNTPQWIKNIGDRNIKSYTDAQNYITKLTSAPDYYIWTVKLLEDKEHIGIITYLKKDYLDYPDIGFAFLPSVYGKGYAFEATHKVMEMLKKHNIRHISAVTILENERSIQLLKRLGFKESKTIFKDGEELLYFLYSAE